MQLIAPMLWIALAAQVTAGTLTAERHGDVRTLFSNEDYPTVAVRKGEQGDVVADLLVNPAGAVDTCTIVLSSGFADLDDATCALLQRRAHFIPAKDGAGKPMYDVVRTPPVTWSLGSFRGFPVPPDYDLLINRAPAGVELPVEFMVDYLVTRDGNSRDCELSGKSAPAELVALACQTLASAPTHVIHNREGLPVEAGNQATFRFSLDKAHTK
jgi:TonB family protein